MKTPLIAVLSWAIALEPLLMGVAPNFARAEDDSSSLMCEVEPTNYELLQCVQEESSSSESESVSRPEDEFVDLMLRYIEASNDDSPIAQVYRRRLKQMVFRDPGSDEYVRYLQEIDARHYDAPEPIYRLAATLQTHWETRFATGLGQRRLRARHGGAKIGGGIAGLFVMAALGISMIRRPNNAPRYFRIFRQAIPTVARVSGRAALARGSVHLLVPAGMGVGGELTGALHNMGAFDDNIPVSPAHIMGLGIRDDQEIFDDETVHNEVTSIVTGVAVSLAVETVLMAATGAALLSGPGVVIVVVALVVGLLIESAMRAYYENREYNKFRDRVFQSRNMMEWALARRDHAYAFTAADSLVKRAENLAAYINRDILTAIETFMGEVQQAAERYCPGQAAETCEAPGYISYRDARVAQGQTDIRRMLNETGQAYHGDWEGYVVRNFLRNHSESDYEAAASELDPSARRRADIYRRHFEQWYLRAHRAREGAAADARREDLFQAYLEGMDRAKDRQLTREMREGNVPRHANQVMLMSAAYLRQVGRDIGTDYMGDHEEELLKAMTSYDILGAAVGIGAFEDAGLASGVSFLTTPGGGMGRAETETAAP